MRSPRCCREGSRGTFGSVSVPVSLGELRAHVDERGLVAYLLTTSDDGRPHSVAVPIEVADDGFRCNGGNRTARNATARPLVSLLWPARFADDYSLIVDGDASVVGEGDARRVVVRPTSAVLHRTPVDGSPRPQPGACGADCVPLDLSAR